MLENNVVQISTGKLLGMSLLPSSILMVSGFIILRVWRNKQSCLQTKTEQLHDELRQLQKQIAELKKAQQKIAELQRATSNTESAESRHTVKPFAAQQSSPESAKSPVKMGLFEYLIEDNIQLRKSAS